MLVTNPAILGGGGDLVTYFDGVNDYVELPVQPHGTQDFSFSIQFYIPSGFNSTGSIPCLMNMSSSAFNRVIIYKSGTNLQGRFLSGLTVRNYALSTEIEDAWRELVVTLDGTQATAQLDGGTLYTAATTGSLNTSDNFFIGSQTNSANFWECYVRRVAIGTIASPEIALFDDTTWVNKGTGSDGIINGATAVLDPAA